MKARIEITMDNAAFDPSPAAKLARILRKLEGDIEAGMAECALHDINGNKVGSFSLEGAK